MKLRNRDTDIDIILSCSDFPSFTYIGIPHFFVLHFLNSIDVVFFTNWRKGPPPQAKKQTNEQKTWLLRTNPTRVYCQDSLYWWSGTKPTISSWETCAHAWVYVPADRLCARHLREGLDTSISTRTLHVPSHKHICHLPVSNPCPTHTAFDSW